MPPNFVANPTPPNSITISSAFGPLWPSLLTADQPAPFFFVHVNSIVGPPLDSATYTCTYARSHRITQQPLSYQPLPRRLHTKEKHEQSIYFFKLFKFATAATSISNSDRLHFRTLLGKTNKFIPSKPNFDLLRKPKTYWNYNFQQPRSILGRFEVKAV